MTQKMNNLQDQQEKSSYQTFFSLRRDFVAGIVVFLVALPLSLGIALASGAPLFSGILGGIVGGLLVGLLSGSAVSVSGPSAALASIVAQQITKLHSFEAFLLAVVVAGFLQVILGILKSGLIAEFFPSSVLKGLLAATGILIVLKQIPHLLGYDSIPFGDTFFLEGNGENTFSEISSSFLHIQMGALFIGLFALSFLLFAERFSFLKKGFLPAPLLAVLGAVTLGSLFHRAGTPWSISPSHLVSVPQINNFTALMKAWKLPDFQKIFSSDIYVAAFLIATSASLETLLNLKAADKIDPQQRLSPPNRELLAHGIANILLGLMGGIPITSAIVRSSTNINAGGRSPLATIVHGLLLLGSIVIIPHWINQIPLAVLAAILIVVGIKLARPGLFLAMWREGANQFVPFFVTIIAIIFTNLLFGILIGLTTGLFFVLYSNLRFSPWRQIIENNDSEKLLRFQFGSHLSFLNKPFLNEALDKIPSGTYLLLDAHACEYIDPDILSFIDDYVHEKAPIRNVHVHLLGFRAKYDSFSKEINSTIPT